jgi:hypothetical protein
LAVQFGSSVWQFGTSVWQFSLAKRFGISAIQIAGTPNQIRIASSIWQFDLAGIVSGRNCGQESNFGCSSFGGAP